MKTIIAAILLFASSLAAAEVRWQSATTGTELRGELRQPTTKPSGAVATVVYLKNLSLPRIGQESDDVILGEFAKQGMLVLVLDYAKDAKAVSPALNADLLKLRMDIADSKKKNFLRDVYATLRNMVDFVVVDTPPGFTPEVIATIDNATMVCMVGMLDALSLKNTKLGLETLGLMDYDPKKIQLVLNRADTRVGISQHDVVAVLGSEPNIFIPSDREIPRSVNEGIPITLSRPQSYAAASFHDLAGLFLTDVSNGEPVAAGAAASSAARQSRSLFRFRRK